MPMRVPATEMSLVFCFRTQFVIRLIPDMRTICILRNQRAIVKTFGALKLVQWAS